MYLKMQLKAHNLLIKYCRVYSMWLDALHKYPGANLPSLQEKNEWHQVTKEIYDYANMPYPKWLEKELKALH